MKIVELSCGLGNQMFQYAFALSLKHHFNMPVLLDKGFYDNPEHKEHPPLSLDIFPITLPYATQEQKRKAKKSSLVRKILKKCGLPLLAPYCVFDYNPKLLQKKSYSYYTGFFQNPLYFSDLSSAIKSAFTPPPLQAQ
ncbi:alpha-1,2-fucosyltransferase [Helicobacter himalayensis]|uniref:alpha-1,2-fucosyltransferase n=1 Tax=Helicobacter himalayensis TaxID=1591088 RepID=UPI003D6F8D02